MNKPSVFIGSSTEGLPIADQIKTALNEALDVTIWKKGVFALGESHLSSLLRGVKAFDFSVFVCAGDDKLTKRKEKILVPRDNVLFELGLFTGAVGSRRAFPVIIREKGKKVALPTDLNGINMLMLDVDRQKNLTESAKETLCDLQKTILETHEETAEFQILPSTGIAVGYYHNFLEPVCSLLAQKSPVIKSSDGTHLSYNDFRFEILLPTSLRDANRDGADYHTKQQNLQKVLIGNEHGHRPYPFHTAASQADSETITFHDYPTTLKSSDEAVDYITRDAYLSSGGLLRKAFDKRELDNFQRTIRLLLESQSKAIAFRDRITFRTLDKA